MTSSDDQKTIKILLCITCVLIVSVLATSCSIDNLIVERERARVQIKCIEAGGTWERSIPLQTNSERCVIPLGREAK